MSLGHGGDPLAGWLALGLVGMVVLYLLMPTLETFAKHFLFSVLLGAVSVGHAP